MQEHAMQELVILEHTKQKQEPPELVLQDVIFISLKLKTVALN